LYVERAAAGANEADGPFSASCGAVRPPGEAGAKAGLVRRPPAGDAAAEDGRAQHRPLEPRLAVDVPPRHARHLAGRVQAGDALEGAVQDATAQVRLDTAEVLAGEGK